MRGGGFRSTLPDSDASTTPAPNSQAGVRWFVDSILCKSQESVGTIGGLYRNACSQLQRISTVATGIVTYAVIPGKSFSSGFANSMIVS